MTRRWRWSAVVVVAAVAFGFQQRGLAFPVDGDQTILPPQTELNEEALEKPREVFHSESMDGIKSYLVNLGDMAFNSPAILGNVSQQANISCGTCHVNGAGNPKLFMPKMSSRPGTFDTTGSFFNPKANNFVFDAVRIPSLRGVRYLAPYGHDGRITSLREFVRTVIVSEFAGPEPSPAVLDGLVAYLHDIDFLPNQNLGPGGQVTGMVSDAVKRGEALFGKPFPHQPSLSCAGCHIPSAAFVDHRQHDVGSGGLFKTPTLRNADFSAPYFHDGRYDTYEQVVEHFDHAFDLGLSAQDKDDLVAYLTVVGNGVLPYEREGAGAKLKEINDFSTVLDVAIDAGDKETVSLAVETIGGELRELTEQYPDRKDTSLSGGERQRALARRVLKEMVLSLRRIDLAMADGRASDAASENKTYRTLRAAIPPVLTQASPWSLFNKSVHESHYTALRQIILSKHTAH